MSWGEQYYECPRCCELISTVRVHKCEPEDPRIQRDDNDDDTFWEPQDVTDIWKDR